jgi:polyferredoxin
MSLLRTAGILLSGLGLAMLLLANGLDRFRLQARTLKLDNPYHQQAVLQAAAAGGVLEKTYGSSFSFVPALREVLAQAAVWLEKEARGPLPEDVKAGTVRMGSWQQKNYLLSITAAAAFGPVRDSPWLFFSLSIGLLVLGGILCFLPMFGPFPHGINDHTYHTSLSRGLQWGLRTGMLSLSVTGLLAYGVVYMQDEWTWPLITAGLLMLIIGLVLWPERRFGSKGARSASPRTSGWLGVVAGLLLIAFYVLLYWAPQHIGAWVAMVDPLSRMISGMPASHWFFYGLLYTLGVLVMGVRMLAKYWHNRYQVYRTLSVMFFQTAFAFLIPEILVRLQQPYYDFKNIWPLNYTFFFDYNLKYLLSSGGLGVFMLVWGIVLTVIGVPVLTYFFGKRWYCSWVCGCGGLAETVGDPWRHLSDKSLRAWRVERWLIHGVLVFAVVMTAAVLYTYFTGEAEVFYLASADLRNWYGFFIGSSFAGVIGTGFYPLMGNRTWCRFGCPLAAYLGLVQRFKSRFRITVNGGQCISCGNCSTYCEMGIDVRHYAQRGQDIVRSSCVGCGICSAVCPRGVLRLENLKGDVNRRAEETRVIQLKDSDWALIEL